MKTFFIYCRVKEEGLNIIVINNDNNNSYGNNVMNIYIALNSLHTFIYKDKKYI